MCTGIAYKRRNVMRAVAKLIEAASCVNIADVSCRNDPDSCWIDCYSYEPLGAETQGVESVLQAVRALDLGCDVYSFEVRLFCCDGAVCYNGNSEKRDWNQ